MKHLHIDIETYCDLDVSDVGVYRYAEDDSFKIILFAYSFDGEPVTVIDCSNDEYPGESIPARVWKALTDPSILKIAHNANFEYVCIKTYYGVGLDLKQWFCTMVGALYLGLPRSLAEVSKVLGLTEKKDTKGKTLIAFFCKPCKPTKKNDGRTLNLPEYNVDDIDREGRLTADQKYRLECFDKWNEFKAYNAQDVRTEKEIYAYISRFPGLPDHEIQYWILDQEINAIGITIDREFIEAARITNDHFVTDVRDRIVKLTGVQNPNSVPQLKAWLRQRLGYEVPSLDQNYVNDAIEGGMLPPDVEKLLRLRQFSSNTSVTKYDTMLAYEQPDKRIRGQIQFYGANRTGRFAGQGVQPQNLKKTIKNTKKAPTALNTAREAVLKGLAELLYDDVPKVISKLTRTALVAAEGCSLVVSDFAAIEARVLAWEAGENWVLDVFNSHGLIYEATAANMFNVPLDQVKSLGLRPKGKVATLALGYQGASGALINMGALREGLDEAELPAIVRAWRSANPHIVKFWREVEQAAKHVISKKTRYVLRKPYCNIIFSYDRGYLFIELPSGRRLAYYSANVEKGRLTYWGIKQEAGKPKIWMKQDTYGGSLVENITQAVARDCLCDAMYRMYYDEKIPILMHVHDEIISEARDEDAPATLERMNKIMAVSPVWAKDLPLKGDGYISKYYKKD